MEWDMALVAAITGCIGYLLGFVTAALMRVAGEADADEDALEALLCEAEALRAQAQSRRAAQARGGEHV